MKTTTGNVSDCTRRPTLREVARTAGVAISTASRVLNTGVGRPALRARVLAAADAVGYRPDALARSLRTGSTHSIGFLVPDIGNPLFGSIARGAASYLGQYGYSMLLAVSDGHADRERELVQAMIERRVDGVMLSCSDESDQRMITALREAAAPIVLLDRDLPVERAHRVLVEHRRGIEEAIEHLASLGHTEVAFVGGSLSVRPGRERYEAFRQAAEARGILNPDLVHVGSFEEEFGRSAGLRLLSRRESVTAVISGGNQLSIGLLHAVREADLAIPGDLSFIGCDDIDALVLNNPPMSAVSRSVEEMGEEAASLLLRTIREEVHEPVTHIIYSRLVVRRSTAAPRSLARASA